MIDFSFNITKNWLVELIVLRKGWPCVIDLNLNLNTANDVMFAHGFSVHLITFGYTIIEFNIFNDEWGLKDSDNDDEMDA